MHHPPYRSRWLRRAGLHALGVLLPTALVATLLDVPARAAPGFQPRSAPQERSVPGHPVAPEPPGSPAESTRRAWHGPAKVTWPAAGTATVDVAPASGRAVRAGTLPVSVATAAPAAAAEAGRAGEAAVAQVAVTVVDRAATKRAGVNGLLLTVRRADGVTAKGRATVAVDYSGFRGAYGGDWATRLRLVRLPECALTATTQQECRAGTPVPTHNDLKAGTLTADVDAAPQATVYAVTAAPEGPSGDYKASSLAPSGNWTQGGNSGSFAWSYDIDVPPAPGELEPDINLTYSSSAVDGRTASTNSQPGWLGEGWDYDPGFIERTYVGCTDDMGSGANNTAKTGDLCWKTDNAVMSLGGQSSTLVRDDATGTWRIAEDDSSRVEHLNGTATDTNNGDNDNEYWKITKPDGTQYWFGKNRLPGWATGKTETASAFTVPVFGNHTGEPCHGSSYATSFCNQAWRWQLDYVVDPHGNAQAMYYIKESNAYAKNMASTATASYTRGGYLDHIDYGLRAGQAYAALAPAQVGFGVSERCLASCSTFDAAHAANWPDTPVDQNCASGANCTNVAPSFWSRKRLTSITTKVLVSGAYTDVDSWALTQDFPATGDSSTPSLWLSTIVRTGKVGTPITLPQVDFGGTPYDNRVDAAEGRPPLHKYRLTKISNETGADTLVTYKPTECTYGATPTPDANDKPCFPSWWTPEGATQPVNDWFHKYVVAQVVEDDKVAGAESEVTSYEYLGGVAWHRDDSEFTLDKHRTWNGFRGYAKVRVYQGAIDRSLTETIYFRGMDGDKKADGTTRSVTVADSEGNPATDANPLAGSPREVLTYTGDGGTVASTTVTDPWLSAPTATHTPAGGLPAVTARLSDTAATKTRELVTTTTGTAWRRTEESRTFNSDGLVLTADDKGDLAVTGDETCTRTTYAARDTTNWQLDYEATELTTSTSCSTTPTEANTLTEQKRRYDGQTVAVAPKAGQAHETGTDVLDRYDAGAAKYSAAGRVYDVYGREISETDEAGATETTAYNPATGAQPRTVTTTNAKQHVTTETLDVRGNVTISTDPNGRTTFTDYDALGRVSAVWLPGRAKTQPADYTYSYSVSRTAPTVVTTKTLLPNGTYRVSLALQDGLLRERQSQETGHNGGRVIEDTFFDSQGREAKSNDTYWNSAAPASTVFGVADVDVPEQTVTTYDGQDRETAEILKSSGVEKWRTTKSYSGNYKVTIPPAGGTPTLEVTDAGDEVVELRQFKSGTPTFTAPASSYDATKLSHDPLERLTKVVDPAGNSWTFGHDKRGNQINASDPDEGASTSTFDAVGRTLTTTTAKGTIAYTYDELGRKTSTRSGSATGPKLAEWTYDTAPGGKGEVATSTRYVDGAAYTIAVDGYDAGGRTTGMTVTIPDVAGKGETKLAGSYTLSNTYTPTGEVATTTYPAVAGLPAETVNQAYTTSGLPSTVDNGDVVYVGGASYTPFGEVKQTTFGPLGDRVVRTRTYDPGTHRPTLVVTDRERTDPQTIDSTSYTYDPSGNVTRIRTDSDDAATVDDQCFRYDYLSRLTEAWTATDACASSPAQARVGGMAPYWQSFTYDAIGNRKTEVRHAASGDATRTYTYPAATSAQPHALTQVTTTGAGARTDTFEYDPAGNTKRRVTAAGDQTLEWDLEGRLAKSTIGGAETSFVYDADGERLLRRDPTSTTLYLDGQEIKLVRDGGVLSGTRYYNGPDGTVARTSDGGLHYLLADRQGTDDLSVDAATLSYTRRKSSPFGGSRGTAPAAWPSEHGFVGGTVDPTTGLIELGARDYDPDTGRFISVDPVMDFEEPQQVNGYAYSNNNPVTMSDPDGQRYDNIEDYCYYHKCNKKAKRAAIKRTNARLARERRAWLAYQKWLKIQKAKARAAAKKRAAARAKAKAKARAKAKAKKKRGCKGFFGCVGHGLKKGWDKTGGKVVHGVKKHWRGITQTAITGAALLGGAACIMATAGICGGAIAGYAIAAGIGAGGGAAIYAVGAGKHTGKGYAQAGAAGAASNVAGVYFGKVALRAGAALKFKGSASGILRQLFSKKKYWKP